MFLIVTDMRATSLGNSNVLPSLDVNFTVDMTVKSEIRKNKKLKST